MPLTFRPEHHFRPPILTSALTVLWLLFWFWFVPPTSPCADDRPFANGANWGGTGLMEIPTARVLDDGQFRAGYAKSRPYAWIAGAMGIFPGLEFGGRFTELDGIPGFPTAAGINYGDYKDKAFDLKYQIFPESRRFPALAVGLQDFHGTQLYPAQYIAVSRQFFPLDITLGLGTKRLKGGQELPLVDDLGLFGGVEWAVSERLHLMAEYNPIDYQNDVPPQAVPQGANLPFNVGLRARVLPGLDIGVTWQRGDTLGFYAYLGGKLGQPIRPKQPDPPYRKTVESWHIGSANASHFLAGARLALEQIGFRQVAVIADGLKMSAEVENTKYLSNAKAAGRALRVLLAHAPEGTEALSVVFKRRGLAFLEFAVAPGHLRDFFADRIDEALFTELVTCRNIQSGQTAGATALVSKHEKAIGYGWGVKPDVATFLNDPSGVFKVRLGAKPYVNIDLWKGGAAGIRYDLPLYSNVTSSNVPLKDAVRSDAWLYMGKDPVLERLVLDQAFHLGPVTWARVSGGYLEYMYAGAGGELLHLLWDGLVGIGLESDWVRKRRPGSAFELTELDRYTLLGNLYLTIPYLDASLQLQYGRFLAEDVGWRLNVSRQYDTGVILGAWYSITDTDPVPGFFNKGYNDKGVYISLPVEIFTGRDSSRFYSYGISPWTRDVAQSPAHWSNLSSLAGGLTPAAIKSKLNDIKD